jgi:hypothetical protein
VAVTGLANDSDVLRSWSAGFSGHLVKPVNRENIRVQMERARAAQPPA